MLIFINSAGSGGLVFFLPFLMFIFLLALGEDYNILVMTRIREEAQRLPLREAVTAATGRDRATITSAGLVLAGTFGVFAVVGGGGSGGSQIRDIGLGLALGILMDTFLVRTLLVPSTVVLLGRWNWWPSRMSRPDAPAGPGGHPAARPSRTWTSSGRGPVGPGAGRRPARRSAPPGPAARAGRKRPRRGWRAAAR